MCMGLEELYGRKGKTLKYYGGLWTTLSRLVLDYVPNHIKTPFCTFSEDESSFEKICPKFFLGEGLI
jgi:hypothetical protein